ncbi:MAG: ferredoxin family protein [Chlorobiaceae bacterium]|nr:ferredoxin family protein [Chlorobiaceae bacterium]
MNSSQTPPKKRKRLLAPREEIAWFPEIDVSNCSGCGDCADFCKPGVFEPGNVDPAAKVLLRPRMTVAYPYNCIVLCTRCLPVCPSGAITLPVKEDFDRFVEYVD